MIYQAFIDWLIGQVYLNVFGEVWRGCVKQYAEVHQYSFGLLVFLCLAYWPDLPKWFNALIGLTFLTVQLDWPDTPNCDWLSRSSPARMRA